MYSLTMYVIKFLLVLNLLATECIICALISTPDLSNSLLIHNGAIKILSECLKNETVTGMTPTVGVMGASDDFFSVISSVTDPIPIAILGKFIGKTVDEVSYRQPKMKHQKLKYIVNIVNSRLDLAKSLLTWTESIWRSAAAKFIVLEEAPSKNHCHNAQAYSEILWSFDLMNSIVICTNSTGNLILYSFNPFNSQASEPWHKVSTLNILIMVKNYQLGAFNVNNMKSHDFVIFRSTFNEIMTCESTFFKKDLTLNGFPVYIGTVGFRETMMSIVDNKKFNENVVKISNITNQGKGTRRIHMTRDMWNMFAGFDKDIMETLFIFLNATVMLNINLRYDFRAKFMVQMDGFTGSKLFLEASAYDIILNSEYLSCNDDISTKYSARYVNTYNDSEDLNKLIYRHFTGYEQMMYPVTQRDITVIINNRGYVNIFTRLVSFLDPKLWISMLIVLCVVVIGLKITGGQSFGPVILNALRFSLGIAIQPIPTGLPARIIIGCLMPYFLIMVTSFQGYVSYILTVPRALSNVDSLSELKNSGYKISVGYEYVHYSKSLVDIADRLEMHQGLHCTEVVQNNTQAACIDDSVYLKSQAAKYKTLHVMKEPLTTTYLTYFARPDWPLYKRFDTLLSRLRESGIVNCFLKRYEESSEIGINIAVEEQEANEAKEMNRTKFKRTFLLLLIGLALSSFIFFIELLVFQVKKWSVNHCAIVRVGKIRSS